MNETTIPIVEAYVSVYEVLDGRGDRIKVGAYHGKTKTRLPLPFLDSHGPRVGWWLTAKADAVGLRLKGYLDLNRPGADFVLSQLRAGRDGFSVGIKSRRGVDPHVIRDVAEVTEGSWAHDPYNPKTRLISLGYASSIPAAWKTDVRRAEGVEWALAHIGGVIDNKVALRRQEALATRRAGLLRAREENRHRDPLFN
jgi:hypothetical protein